MFTFKENLQEGEVNKEKIETNRVVNLDSSVSPEFLKDIKSFYEDCLQNSEKYTRTKVNADNLTEKIEGEQGFYVRVLDTINKAIKENEGKEVVVFFDIDETLTQNKFFKDGGGNSFKTILRPSALKLLKAIRLGNIRVGFLTSRGNVLEDLEDQLKPLNLLINKECVLSSCSVPISEEESDKMWNEREELNKSLPREKQFSYSNADNQKIKILNEFLTKRENSLIIPVPVDDYKNPLFYKYGVSLSEKEKFDI